MKPKSGEIWIHNKSDTEYSVLFLTTLQTEYVARKVNYESLRRNHE